MIFGPPRFEGEGTTTNAVISGPPLRFSRRQRSGRDGLRRTAPPPRSFRRLAVHAVVEHGVERRFRRQHGGLLIFEFQHRREQRTHLDRGQAPSSRPTVNSNTPAGNFLFTLAPDGVSSPAGRFLRIARQQHEIDAPRRHQHGQPCALHLPRAHGAPRSAPD